MHERKEIDIIFDPITITRHMDATGRYETETYEDECLCVSVDRATKKLSEALAHTLKINADEAYDRAARYVERCADFDETIDVCGDLEYQLLCKCFIKDMRNRLYKRMDKDYSLDGRKSDYVFSALDGKWYSEHPDDELLARLFNMPSEIRATQLRHSGMTEEEAAALGRIAEACEKACEEYANLLNGLERKEAKQKDYKMPSVDAEQIVDANRPVRKFSRFVF